ncbi:MAG: hypothetical protein VKI83_03445 [Synechococcaceae cyanobacterium]|nr:hypothetical protein [Synechococcaceae cyanobacterium]
MNRRLRRAALALLRPLVQANAAEPANRPPRQAGRAGALARSPAAARGVKEAAQRAAGQGPAGHPRLLLLWQGGLTTMALAALLQSLLAPRWPQAELPAGFAQGLRLGGIPLRLIQTLPARRSRDLAFSETLVFAVEEQAGTGVGSEKRAGAGAGPGRLELRLVAVQTRHRSDLAVPRLTRDRPDLRLTSVKVSQASPSFAYGKGLWQGRAALQTCLTGKGEGGFSEAQLSQLRDLPASTDLETQVSHVLGLADLREFNCVLVTMAP